jgi:hypothetical protein
MPTVFRAMKVDAADGLPLRGTSMTTLGIRPSDFTIDPVTTMVAKNGNGTSCNSSPNTLPQSIRPGKFFGGKGGTKYTCFKLGTGAWGPGLVAPGLDLCIPDPTDPDHGMMQPESSMLLADLELAMEAIRPNWQVV